MEKIITQLQEMLSHQSEDISRISHELYTQQKEIASLHAQFAKLQAKLKLISMDSNIRNPDEESPPPHW